MTESRSREIKARATLVLLGVLGSLLATEIAARVWVRMRWTSDEIGLATTHASEAGRYANHPNLPYVLSSQYEGHNSYGFSGPEFEIRRKPGVHRIVLVGGSSSYGSRNGYPVELQRLLDEAGYRSEVLNAGVPGWVSTENLLNLQLRVLPLDPDLIIVYQGRNDLLPQSYNDLRYDYSHYRVADYSFAGTNKWHKSLNRLSNLFMILSVNPDRFGWSSMEENPVCATIRFENKPTSEKTIENLKDPAPTRVFQHNVESMVQLARGRGVSIVLATMAFRPELIATYGILTDAPEIVDALRAQLERNNMAVREVGALYGVPVAESAVLAKEPQMFADDVHMTKEGQARRAKLIFDTIQRYRLLERVATPSPPR